MDRKTLVVGTVAVAIVALGGGVAFAAQQQEPPKVDKAAAEEAALGVVPGEVTESELEREGVYEVEVMGKDGKLHEVTVSANDGKVLGQEIDEEDSGTDDQGSDDQGAEDDD